MQPRKVVVAVVCTTRIIILLVQTVIARFGPRGNVAEATPDVLVHGRPGASVDARKFIIRHVGVLTPIYVILTT